MVSAISGTRISTCRPRPQRLGDAFQIDLGLPRTGDAVEQLHREALGRHRIAEAQRRGVLGVVEGGNRMVRLEPRQHLGRQQDRLQNALVDQAVDDGGRDAGLARRLALGAGEAIGEMGEEPGTGGRHASRGLGR